MESSITKNRLYKFDNIKWFTILLVVIGHFIEVAYVEKYTWANDAFLIIYSFHMPLFLFICGLFRKPYKKESKFEVKKFVFYIVLGYGLKLLTYILEYICKGKSSFEFFGGRGIPWFMFVLAAYLIITFLLRDASPVIVMVVSVIIGCCSGYVDKIGDFLWLSRIFVFLPVYMIGYYLSPEKVLEFTSKIYVKLSSIILSCTFIVIVIMYPEETYKLRRLFTGANPYSAVYIDNCSCLHRMLCYFIAAVMCIAVISVIPNCKISMITKWGKNTISVFFWHRLVLYFLQYTGFFKDVNKLDIVIGSIFVAFIIPTLVTIFLSFGICMRPIEKVKKFIFSIRLEQS